MKKVIDKISQPNWSILIVYSDWTTEVKSKKDLQKVLIEAKKWGIKKKSRVIW